MKSLLWMTLLVAGLQLGASPAMPEVPSLSLRIESKMRGGRPLEAERMAWAALDSLADRSQDAPLHLALVDQLLELRVRRRDVEDDRLWSVVNRSLANRTGPDIAPTLRWVSLARGIQGQMAEADSLASQALLLATRISPVPALSPYYRARAAALTQVGAYADALHQLDRALAECDSIGTPGEEEIWVLNQRGVVLRRLGENDDSIRDHERARALLEGEDAADSHLLAAVLMNLGTVYKVVDRQKDAVAVYRRAHELREELYGSESMLVAIGLHQLADPLRHLARYDEAEAAMEWSRRVFTEQLPADHLYIAASNQRLGMLYNVTGEYAKARQAHLRTGAVYEARLGREHPRFAYNTHSLGNVLLNMGNYAEAERHYRTAAQLFANIHGGPSADESLAIASLGQCYFSAGRYVEAREQLETALAMHLEQHGESHARTNHMYSHLGLVAWALGEEAKAEEWFVEASRVVEELYGPRHRIQANNLRYRAWIARESQEYERASELLDEAVAIARENLGEDHPGTAPYLVDRATIALDMGDHDGALRLASLAESLARDHLRGTARVLPERMALRYSEVLTRGVDVAVAAAISDPSPARIERAFGLVVNSRAVVQDEMAHRRRGLEEGGEAVAELRGALREAQLAYAQHGGETPDSDPELYREKRRQLRDSKEQIESQLAQRSSDAELGVRPLDPSTLKERIPDGAVLVSFHRHRGRSFRRGGEQPSRYAVFVVDPRRDGIQLVSLPEGDAIERSLEAWRSEMRPLGSTRGLEPVDLDEQRSMVDYRRTAQDLYGRIWEPLESRLEGAEMVLTVSDGALHFLNFNALIDERGSFLLESGPMVHCLSSERALTTLPEAGKSGGILAVGGVGYGTAETGERSGSRAAECVDLQTIEFSPLPETGTEAGQVAELFRAHAGGSVTLRGGSDATEEEVFALAPGRQILHFATHAFVLDEDCEAGLASEGSNLRLLDSNLQEGNPLERAGLALAGANGRAHAPAGSADGLLTAEEISALDLSGVNWVVLSACDTGLGTLHDEEGVLGLRRAFEVAGARSMIASLWPVSDEATREWMNRLYAAHLRDGRGTADAVRAASLETLRSRREQGRSEHPYYWGAFISVGHWN